MDYGHHDPLHAHRVYSLQAVERAPQPPCDDDGKPGDDDGNPYTCRCHAQLHPIFHAPAKSLKGEDEVKGCHLTIGRALHLHQQLR